MNTAMITSVFATLDLPGYHRWPLAQGKREYLADRHRHLFHIRVKVIVSHNDRDVEFHDLSDTIREWWGPGSREWGDLSCESIARQLLDYLSDQGMQIVLVEIGEDKENGAAITVIGECDVHDQ